MATRTSAYAVMLMLMVGCTDFADPPPEAAPSDGTMSGNAVSADTFAYLNQNWDYDTIYWSVLSKVWAQNSIAS